MQVNIKEQVTVDKEIERALKNNEKRFFRCSGVIKNKKSWLYGKPCKKVLAEANSNGKLHGKIKCPHCGHINEV